MTEAKLDWMKTKPAEVEKIVVELAKQGESPAKIGLILRDKHGIPKAKLLGKKICQILNDNKMPIKSEKEIVEGKIKKTEIHVAKNKYDHSAKRSVIKKLWIINKINKRK